MILALLLLLLIANTKIKDKIESYIYAFVLWTVFMFVMVEILSSFNAISTLNLWLAWGGFDFFLIFMAAICMKININKFLI